MLPIYITLYCVSLISFVPFLSILERQKETYFDLLPDNHPSNTEEEKSENQKISTKLFRKIKLLKKIKAIFILTAPISVIFVLPLFTLWGVALAVLNICRVVKEQIQVLRS